ncbi:hypothetical protein ACLQ8T_16880 (plasmid) [Glutamicibacter sp. FR1]|uniref:hypothetical protein n=1 Tax=Glutamicibacter sp. FR1 TaxID=3393744 RepID=UPI0039AEF0DC
MKKFELVDKSVTIQDVEMLLVMIERTDNATLIHWRVPKSQVGGFGRAPQVALCESSSDKTIPMEFRNSGGSGTESHMVDVYPGRFDSGLVIRDVESGTIVFQEGL